MRAPASWLSRLKAAELHKLAVSLGTPCSGTKAVQVQGIERALALLPTRKSDTSIGNGRGVDRLSVVSIDMGIRNLAYSAWTSELESDSTGSVGVMRYRKPVLRAWRKIDISSSTADKNMDDVQARMDQDETKTRRSLTRTSALKESFEPIDYADRAYDFVKTMLAEHNPSHVLIERQRFRTGGNSAVQEWTIRVGVFEGMLYAVLRSLAAGSDRYRDLVIEPILPGRVNRYWLENSSQSDIDVNEKVPAKKSAREVKQMKISLVKDLLVSLGQNGDEQMFGIDENLKHMVSTFLNKGSKGGKRTNARDYAEDKNRADFEISKLDDLADCFLQGLAWQQWYNNRLRLDFLKEKALLPAT